MQQALSIDELQDVERLTRTNEQFLTDVLNGLRAPQKRLSPKYFYDEKGSALFDAICESDEYYPYKTEIGMLPKVASDLATKVKGELAVVEFGAGSVQKIQPFFDAVAGIKRFIAIDISGEHLRASCRQLGREYQSIQMHPVESDFTQHVPIRSCTEKLVGYFPGSTIGNFEPHEARNFLINASKTLGPDSYMIVGVDTRKSPSILHRAYNDKKGITALFNLNILQRINFEFGANFDLAGFEHYAHYNAKEGRIEMHLVSLKEQSYTLCDEVIAFDAGESIHTECSYKYSPKGFSDLADSSGWSVDETWLAKEGMFSVFLLKNF